jgi:hypothetical protein
MDSQAMVALDLWVAMELQVAMLDLLVAMELRLAMLDLWVALVAMEFWVERSKLSVAHQHVKWKAEYCFERGIMKLACPTLSAYPETKQR